MCLSVGLTHLTLLSRFRWRWRARPYPAPIKLSQGVRTLLVCPVSRSRWSPISPLPAISPPRIAGLVEGIKRGDRFQTLLGITGSGKSATIAWTIEQVQKPTLILAPNKSLAAQLANEFKEFFPENRVEYFVSYYDYYQPEAYIASSDTYIEKDSSVNDEIDRLRHSATSGLLTRDDVIVVASVSCIYGMGNPEEYRGQLLELHTGVDYDQRSILRRLVDLQYDRNDMNLVRGNFRVRGDTIEVHPAYEEHVLRIEMFGDTVERLVMVDPLTGEQLGEEKEVLIFPATHYVTGEERMRTAVQGIEIELQERLQWFEQEGKLLEAQRLRMAHAVRPRDDGRGRLLQRHRELQPPHRRPIGGRGAVHAHRLLPRRTSSSSSTSATRRCHRCTASTWATARARTT